ncbi:MAG: hypothetical protein ACODAE_02070, partial [Gemmatimonadota bacterium]
MPVFDRPASALVAGLIAVGLLGASACGAGPGDAPAAGSAAGGAADARRMTIGEPVAVESDLEVTRLAPGVWLHTSWYTYPGGARVPSNGLLVRAGAGLLLIDTAWGEHPTERLLEWIDESVDVPVTRAVITH